MKGKSSSISEKITDEDDFNSLKSEKLERTKQNGKSSKDDDDDEVDEYEIVRQSSQIEEDEAEQ